MTRIHVAFGEGVDPSAAAIHLGIDAPFRTTATHYEIDLPDGVTRAQFMAAVSKPAAEAYLAKAQADAVEVVKTNSRALMMDAWPDVADIVTRRDAILAQLAACDTIEAVESLDLTVAG